MLKCICSHDGSCVVTAQVPASANTFLRKQVGGTFLRQAFGVRMSIFLGFLLLTQ